MDITADLMDEYRGPEAAAKAARLYAELGTEQETTCGTIWLLRYVTVNENIQWPDNFATGGSV